MVTVEIAAASILLAGVVAAAIAVVVAGFRVAECQVTANEVARQYARGDAAAVEAAVRDRPEGTTVRMDTDDGVAAVRVTCDAQVGLVDVPLDVSAQVVTES